MAQIRTRYLSRLLEVGRGFKKCNHDNRLVGEEPPKKQACSRWPTSCQGLPGGTEAKSSMQSLQNEKSDSSLAMAMTRRLKPHKYSRSEVVSGVTSTGQPNEISLTNRLQRTHSRAQSQLNPALLARAVSDSKCLAIPRQLSIGSIKQVCILPAKVPKQAWNKGGYSISRSLGREQSLPLDRSRHNPQKYIKSGQEATSLSLKKKQLKKSSNSIQNRIKKMIMLKISNIEEMAKEVSLKNRRKDASMPWLNKDNVLNSLGQHSSQTNQTGSQQYVHSTTLIGRLNGGLSPSVAELVPKMTNGDSLEKIADSPINPMLSHYSYGRHASRYQHGNHEKLFRSQSIQNNRMDDTPMISQMQSIRQVIKFRLKSKSQRTSSGMAVHSANSNKVQQSNERLQEINEPKLKNSNSFDTNGIGLKKVVDKSHKLGLSYYTTVAPSNQIKPQKQLLNYQQQQQQQQQNCLKNNHKIFKRNKLVPKSIPYESCDNTKNQQTKNQFGPWNRDNSKQYP